jgi:hypothetical protein
MRIVRIILLILHFLLALGGTLFALLSGVITADNDFAALFVGLSWCNIFMVLLIWGLYAYMVRSGDYSIMTKFDTSRPFNKNIINLMAYKIINSTVICCLAVTIVIIPSLFVSEDSAASVAVYVGMIALYAVWTVWICIVAIKYQRLSRVML